MGCRLKDGVKAAEELLNGIGSQFGGNVASWKLDGGGDDIVPDWITRVSEEKES